MIRERMHGTSVQCDEAGCDGDVFASTPDRKLARDHAADRGWSHVDGLDWCPEHTAAISEGGAA